VQSRISSLPTKRVSHVFERGFFRVEVYSVDDRVQFDSEKAIREAGKLRLEGKTYVMHDNDVSHFLFNV
jgi:ribosome-binding ATPase